MKVTVDLLNADQVSKELEKEILQFQSYLATTFKQEVTPRTPIDSGRARRGWQERQEGKNKIVENQVPYIERLERGYSRQAPNGFVNQSISATIRKAKGKII